VTGPPSVARQPCSPAPLPTGQRHFEGDVAAFQLVERMGLDRHFQIQITAGTAADAGTTLAGQPNLLPVVTPAGILTFRVRVRTLVRPLASRSAVAIAGTGCHRDKPLQLISSATVWLWPGLWNPRARQTGADSTTQVAE